MMKKILILLFAVFSSVCFAQQSTEQEKLKQIEVQQQLLKDGKISYDDYLKNVEAIRSEKSATPTSNETEQSKKIIEETNESAKKKAESDAGKKTSTGSTKTGTTKTAENKTAGSELTKEQAEAQIQEATRKQAEDDAKAKQVEEEKKKAEEKAMLQKQEEEKANSVLKNNNAKELNQANRIRPGDELLKFSRQYYTGMALFVAGEGIGTLGLLIASVVSQSTGGATIGVVGPLFMLGGAVLAGVGVINLTTSFLHIRNAGKLMNQKQDILSK